MQTIDENETNEPHKVADRLERINAAHAQWRKEMEPEFEKIRAAERLTAADFQIIINARG